MNLYFSDLLDETHSEHEPTFPGFTQGPPKMGPPKIQPPFTTQLPFKMCSAYQNEVPATIPSQRGSTKIALDGHYYLMNKRDPNNPERSYWKCGNVNQGCNARLIKEAD